MAKSSSLKTRKCAVCKEIFPENKGVKLLRGASFMCNDCYRKEKKKQKPAGEACEFC